MTEQPESARSLAPARREQILAAVATEGSARIADLAARLSVTPMTLRRDVAALAEEGRVRRIHGGVAAVDEPTDAGRATIGMLVPSLEYYWPDVVRGAHEGARAAGMRLALRESPYGTDDAPGKIRHLVERAGATGLILAPNLPSARATAQIETLVREGVPLVLVERTAVVGGLHEPVESVSTDHAGGAAVAIRHLAGLGHRRIGLVAATRSPTSAHVRRGWAEACAELGLATHLDVSVPEPGEDAWEAALSSLLDDVESTGATALLVHADAAATAIVAAVEERGHHVPGDLSVVAYDDTFAGLFTPRLTAMRPPRRSLGRAAFDLLAARLASPRRPAHRVEVSPTLRVRDTSGPPGGER